MGLSRRKKSGKKIGGSRLIVDGQEIYSTKTFQPSFNKKRKRYEDFVEAPLIVPTTTTTTTIPIETCNLETQNFDNLITQNNSNIIFC
jgi:hypothetical protein